MSMMPVNTKQPVTHWTRVGLTIAGGSLALILLAAVTLNWVTHHKSAFDSRDKWAGMATLCAMIGCFAIAGVVTGITIVFAKRSETKTIAALRAGQGVLAHWTYTTDEWQHYAAHERARANKYFFIISGILVVVLIFPFAMAMLTPSRGASHSSAYEAMLISFVPIALAVGLVWLVTVMPTRSLSREARGEAYISRDGALLQNRYHTWSSWAGGLRSVRLEASDPSTIEFTWSQPGYRGSQTHSVRVPVPRGREDEARKLIAKFN